MSHNYGPLQTWEITWKSGHVEQVQGHQVIHKDCRIDGRDIEPRFLVHGMVNDRWLLVLTALEADVATIRLVTNGERLPEVDAP